MKTHLTRFRRNLHTQNEEGFTLIEILVVILIIGILASIAVPVFLNQRKTANDASVISDVKNIATAIETGLVENSESVIIENMGPGGSMATLTTKEVTICFKAKLPTDPCVLGPKTILSDGVTIDISGTPNAYLITGYHSNGKKYDTKLNNLVYRSENSGLKL